MGNWHEETAVGNAVWIYANSGRDVSLDRNVLSRLGGNGEVDGGMGESSLAVGGVEVLDQGRERVKFWRRCIPITGNE